MANSLLNRFIAISFTILSSVGIPESITAQTQRALLNSDGSKAVGLFQTDARLSTLVNKLQPSIHVMDGQIKVLEASPTTFFTDFVSITTIGELALPKSKIEVVTIQINDLGQLNSTIDMNIFSGFDRLKYVHLNLSVVRSPSDLFEMLENTGSQYKILVSVERPS